VTQTQAQDRAAPVIDPSRTWLKVEERLKIEGDAAVRRNLEIVLDHMRAEARGDLDQLMATVSEHAHYHGYGSPPENSPKGKQAVRAFYEGVITSGISRLEFEIDRLVADRGCVVTEGTMRMAWPGAVLAALGIEVEDSAADYLYEARMAILWMFDSQGLVLAEDTYTATDGLSGIAGRKLAADAVRHV
jgi:limonene-1,2-epoxide hydrolase